MRVLLATAAALLLVLSVPAAPALHVDPEVSVNGGEFGVCFEECRDMAGEQCAVLVRGPGGSACLLY